MGTRSKPTRLEAELLARLGLAPDATSQMVEAAHDGLVAYLETAPLNLRPWAHRQIETVDDAFALLSDPTIDRSAELTAASAATAPSLPGTVAAGGLTTDEEEEDLDELAGLHPATQKGRGKATRQAGTPAPSPAVGQRRFKRLGIGAGVAVGAVVIAVAVFNMNGGPGIPPINGTPNPDTSAAPSLDLAQVGDLMQKIATDPRDTASFLALGALYWNSADYQTSADFMSRILAYDPTNADALVGRGAALYKLGDGASAERDWRAAIAAAPKNQEAYFDLGFMYLEKNPPDMVQVTEMWTKVVAIDPSTDLANYAKIHLDSFASPGPSGATATPAPSGSTATPAATPAASN
jgi:tetratricopeptide (TPR) repeat protein